MHSCPRCDAVCYCDSLNYYRSVPATESCSHTCDDADREEAPDEDDEDDGA